MIAQQTEIKKHSFSEIKRHKQKTYCPVTQMQRLNRALAELLTLAPNDLMYDYLVNRYLQSLDLYHVNGRSGSLLPQAVQ
jgi:hypothetical protein